MDFYTKSAWVIPLIPLAAFLALTALGRNYRKAGVIIGTFAALASFAMSVLVLVERFGQDAVDYNYSFDWIRISGYTLEIGFEVTNLTALMLIVVTFVALLVNVYSAGYMKNDERITVFYGYISLFTFSMLGLVLSDNMLSLYIFWELVGVCSFLLVGFWYTKPAARAAAKKAFIVTRIGDAALLIGILLLFWYMPDHALGFTMIESVFEGQGGIIATGITTVIALLIFLGAVGKSGQFPLHVWLPDAMEGPTPISALIHAATMVAAGVYLLARTFPILEASLFASDVVAYVGGFTALFAATIALAQNDLKRVLAYSTISQLGYMFMAIGLGSWTGGIFHLFTHAFFKALLFLAAGSVIHAVHTQNIQEMGGLHARMRVTTATFAVGALALAGIPPLAGFWSKDAIMAVALEQNLFLFAVGLAAALCTALYMTRVFVLVFLGDSKAGEKGIQGGAKALEAGFDGAAAKTEGRSDATEGQRDAAWSRTASGIARSSDAVAKAKESPRTMTLPLVVLALAAIVAGFIETPWNGWLGGWLSGEEAVSHVSWAAIIGSIAVAAAGIYLGWRFYGSDRTRPAVVKEAAPWLVRLLERKYYVDEAYEFVFVRGLRALGTLLGAFDTYIIGGLVKLAGSAAGISGKMALRLQNGSIGTYSLAAVIGMVVLAAAIIGRRLLS
ncbi:NADH-quinone oxidoreductase subunit L [Paenibacillus sp. PAMC21692]|uniref:NADH-quinone oxidoreductase subunit L n=1 Tax=Paenibacillus sp. PAMC21692 TaxID=2762320 RepID=UPI00164EAC2D|nr:NADH-quinone oxidoreductase subunit L [Paenibacillus sp. PAMC21692]QNK58311.1 NADH-quinone oxidoreductase subunit L [Paenibacillus sp. PAMC21692]